MRDKIRNSIEDLDKLTKSGCQIVIKDIISILVDNEALNTRKAIEKEAKHQAHSLKSRVVDSDGDPVIHADGTGVIFRSDFENMRYEDIERVEKLAEREAMKARTYLEKSKKHKNNAFLKRNQQSMKLEG